MRLLIAGGGTGGHLFPGIAVAQVVQQRYPDAAIIFVGTARGIEATAVPREGFELVCLHVAGLRRVGARRFIKGLLVLPQALWQAVRLIQTFQPDVAVSVGGYAAGPAMLAAYLCRVPCIVMEQNATAGITNRVLGYFADQVITALPSNDFAAAKTLHLGNPVRVHLQHIGRLPYLPKKPLHLLILGGSQGAHALNQAMLDLAQLLQQQGLQHDLVITHQTGKHDVDSVTLAYAQAGINARVKAFFHDMSEVYQACDILLCRSGASTLAEIAILGRPAILVPYPAAAGDHQTSNAQVFVAAGAAIMIPQHKLQAALLLEWLQAFISDHEKLKAMAAAALRLGAPDAAERIVDVIERIGKTAKHVSR